MTKARELSELGDLMSADLSNRTGTATVAGTLVATTITGNISAAQLTGPLPAISGAALTDVPVADQAVSEVKLQVSNAPTNGYALTAQSDAAGGMTWAEIAGGGTNDWWTLVTRYYRSSVPTLVATLNGGRVFNYLYNNGDLTLFRYIAADGSDSFFETFDGTNLTNLIAQKEQTITI